MPAIGISMPVVCDQLRLNGYPTSSLSRQTGGANGHRARAAWRDGRLRPFVHLCTTSVLVARQQGVALGEGAVDGRGDPVCRIERPGAPTAQTEQPFYRARGAS
jgi:hypothetical protein